MTLGDLDPHARRPGELKRRSLQLLAGIIFGLVVILALSFAVASDHRADQAALEAAVSKQQTTTVCEIVGFEPGIGCTQGARMLRAGQNRSEIAAGFAEAQRKLEQDHPHDPINVCNAGDNADYCACKRQLHDQQNGFRVTIDARCPALFRRAAKG